MKGQNLTVYFRTFFSLHLLCWIPTIGWIIFFIIRLFLWSKKPWGSFGLIFQLLLCLISKSLFSQNVRTVISTTGLEASSVHWRHASCQDCLSDDPWIINIDSIYVQLIHSFHDKIQFKWLFNVILGNIQFKGIFNNSFPENSLQKLIQKIEFMCVQFNKIFIQLENPGIAQG